MNAALFCKMKAWRPALFPGDFVIPEGHQSILGSPLGLCPDGVSLENRTQMMMAPIGVGTSMEDSFAKAARHVKSGLGLGQKIGNVMIPCVGRPDFDHVFLRTLEEEGIKIVGTPFVFSEGMVGCIMGSWGTVNLMYNIIEE